MKKLFKTILMIALLCLYIPIQAEGSTINAFFTNPGSMYYDDTINALYEYEGAQAIHLDAWRNDTVNAKIAIQAANSSDITVTMTPIADRDGHEIPQVSIGKLNTTSASLGWGMSDEIPHLNVPDIITDTTSFHMDNTETVYLWLSIKVDQNDFASFYTSKINITDGTSTISLPVHLTIRDLTVPKDDVSLNLWQYPFSSYYYYETLKNEEPFSEAHREILRKELEIYHEMGGESITAAITDEPWSHQVYYDTPSLIKWNISSDNTLWYDYTWFDEWVELCIEEGIDERIDCFSILPFDNSILLHREDGTTAKLFLTPGSDEWNYYWTMFLWSFVYHMEDHGWLDKTYLFIDETGIKYFDYAKTVVDSVPSSDGSTLKFASAVNITPRDITMYDNIDYLAISIASVGDIDEELTSFIAHRNEVGLTTTLYNCSTNYPNAFAISDPVESIWTMWYAQHKNFDGYLRWALDAWTEEPNKTLNFINFEAGDTILLYPDIKDAVQPAPHKSVRLMMIEQGINDIRKYRYLISHSSVTDTMQESLSSIERAYGNFNQYGSMVASSDESRYIIARESVRLEAMNHYASIISDFEAKGIDVSYYLKRLNEVIRKEAYE